MGRGLSRGERTVGCSMICGSERLEIQRKLCFNEETKMEENEIEIMRTNDPEKQKPKLLKQV